MLQPPSPASPEPALPLQSIDPGQQFTWEHSNLEANKPKNRYANVIAYDHSRVILQPLEGGGGAAHVYVSLCPLWVVTLWGRVP